MEQEARPARGLIDPRLPAAEIDVIVHVVFSGHALCGMPGVPGQWPQQHRWVSLMKPDAQPNCVHCIAAARAGQMTCTRPHWMSVRGMMAVANRVMPLLSELYDEGRLTQNEGSLIAWALGQQFSDATQRLGLDGIEDLHRAQHDLQPLVERLTALVREDW